MIVCDSAKGMTGHQGIQARSWSICDKGFNGGTSAERCQIDILL